jgi:hypothetical protein
MLLMPLAVMLPQAQTVRAADAHLDDGGWEWHFDDTNDVTKSILTRVVRIGTASTEVNIPEHLSGTIDLLGIGTDCFYDGNGVQVTKVLSMPDTLTTLGAGAFRGCNAMTSIIIGDGVTSIGNLAFSYCTSLTSVTMPDGVVSIGSYAFYHSTPLASITFLGLIAPTIVGGNWITGTDAGIRGHAFAASDFPTPGNSFYGLIMGTVIPIWAPTFTNSTILNYTMHSGIVHTVELFPIIAEFNATHDLYLIEFDTWTDVHNVSILGESTWNYLFSTPWCSSVTEAPPYLNLTYVVEGVTYRIYFAVPVTRICQVHFAVWVSSTGEGLPFETFHLRYSLGTVYNTSIGYDVVADTEYLDYGENWTVAVLDYFGNVVATQTFTTTGKQNYVSIPINVYSVKVFNQKEDFTKVRIYYNHTGVPLTYYAAPMEPVERFLRGGDYTFIVTFYDDHTAGNSESFIITVTDAEFLMIQGDTISRVISDVAGVKALQQIITTIVTPDTVFIAQKLPFVPTEPVLYIHPWSIVTYDVSSSYDYAGDLFTFNETPGADNGLDLPSPCISAVGTTTTVLDDRFWFIDPVRDDIGAFTDISPAGLLLSPITNWTNVSIYAEELVLTGDIVAPPSYVAWYTLYMMSLARLNGQDLTFVSAFPVELLRESKVRAETLFYYTYYTLQKKYVVTLQLNNSLTQNMSNIDWFIGFPDGCGIDTSSVRVYDLDNDLYLTMGQHYDVTAAGIRMAFDELNASDARSFQFTFYDSNATQGQGLAIAYADSYVATQLGDDSYYMSHASWTNSFPYEYNGQVQVRLNFKDGVQRYIDPTDIVVRDVNANRNLDPTEFTVAAGVITIDNANVQIGEVQSYDIYFKLDMTGKDKFNVLDAAFYFGSFGVSWVMLLFAFAAVLGGLYVWKKWIVVGYFALIIVAVTLILWYFAQTVGGI